MSTTWESAVRTLIAVTALGLAVAACGGGESGPTLPPDVDTVIDAAAETMGTVDTVRFTIERGGAAVYIDPMGTLEFMSAEGRFEGPSAADAVVVVAVSGLRARVGAVAVDGEIWITNPVTGDWEPTPEGYAFDPAALFDPDIGFRPLLAELTDRELIGLDDRDGEDLYHVTGVAGAERISTITAGLVSGQDVTVDLWLDPADGAVREAEFGTVAGTETSDWRIVFLDYGADLTVEIPDLEG